MTRRDLLHRLPKPVAMATATAMVMAMAMATGMAMATATAMVDVCRQCSIKRTSMNPVFNEMNPYFSDARLEYNMESQTRTRLLTLALIGSGLLLAPVASLAIPVPYEFAPGDPVVAAELNANFDDLEASIAAIQANVVPTGVVMAWAGDANSVPDGWLLCDGSAIDRVTYGNLFATISIAHGLGDGVNTFNLPDYRGRFLRGVDGGAGRDPEAGERVAPSAGGNLGDAVGSIQDDELGSHTHTYIRMVSDNNIDGVDSVTTFSGEHHLAGGNVTDPTGGPETRPKNAYVNWVIKI